jgi:hypothetical protein
MRYHAIEDARSVQERLDASLVPPDQSLFDVAIRRSISNWIFYVPATVGVLWLSTVITDLALVTSVLLGVLVLVAWIPALVSVVLAVPRVLIRPLTRRGRHGYLWFLATTLMAALDSLVYGTCLALLVRAGRLAELLPFSI